MVPANRSSAVPSVLHSVRCSRAGAGRPRGRIQGTEARCGAGSGCGLGLAVPPLARHQRCPCPAAAPRPSPSLPTEPPGPPRSPRSRRLPSGRAPGPGPGRSRCHVRAGRPAGGAGPGAGAGAGAGPGAVRGAAGPGAVRSGQDAGLGAGPAAGRAAGERHRAHLRAARQRQALLPPGHGEGPQVHAGLPGDHRRALRCGLLRGGPQRQDHLQGDQEAVRQFPTPHRSQGHLHLLLQQRVLHLLPQNRLLQPAGGRRAAHPARHEQPRHRLDTDGVCLRHHPRGSERGDRLPDPLPAAGSAGPEQSRRPQRPGLLLVGGGNHHPLCGQHWASDAAQKLLHREETRRRRSWHLMPKLCPCPNCRRGGAGGSGQTAFPWVTLDRCFSQGAAVGTWLGTKQRLVM